MSPPASPIRNISDTARWVAVYRAQETRRPDAQFCDPFASRHTAPKTRRPFLAPPAVQQGAAQNEFSMR
jgi:hypothetical protein